MMALRAVPSPELRLPAPVVTPRQFSHEPD